ncbi:MAG: CoA transferase [Chloroflexota bacterium]|nr:MAG: CoA transferase [Chloroflexota bacterium]
MYSLDGIVVLDLARRYPGAYTAMFLADFGAEVIKVDPPGPSLPVQAAGTTEERFAAYNPTDRNKRSIVLDLKKEAARQVLRRLVERADVLIEGFRPGVMDRLGLGYVALSELNPRLVYCALSGFGQTGPYALVPAHDMNFIALGGALSLIGERNGRPYLPSNIVADLSGAGLHGVIGVLLALMARTKTGKGQFVDVAFLDTVLSLMTWSASEYLESGKVPKRGETRFTGSAPWAQVFRCKDGEYITIGAAEPHLWAKLCRALGREDLIPDREPSSREQAEQVIAEFAAIFETRTRDEWNEHLKDEQTCVAPVYYINETLNDPQVLHREMLVELAHPTLGSVKQVGIPIKLSETPGSIRRLGVLTGADTDAVLQELGYRELEVAKLREDGCLG